ncbi:uncharacterized protein LAJ45_08877 [Morchella importuna]|uniref:uncharacterized protein n=1 Tax=Morchella importuna TaxID=1174673 RepID=UPI001E8EEF7D|nr:uncharacterized protein LAJ45_08877 [Morchella importuna]KAH8147078.1 hypothetical protein LAJ45_08877 [Morchella importuna]
MPLWYHPPAVPVNLGAPVYPGPLLYHPAPILIDPRPQHAHDTLYCACQFSLGPAPPAHSHHWSSTTTAPLPEKLHTVKKHASWAGPSRVERSTTDDVRALNIRLSGGHLRAHYTPTAERVVEGAAKVVSLDEATVERIKAEIRRDFERVRHGKDGHAEQVPTVPAQPEPTSLHDHIHIKNDPAPSGEISEYEKEKLAKIRDEVRQELAATYDEKMKALEARELDIQRRMDAIRKREAQWIESYGEGVIKGKPAVSIRHHSAPSLDDQPFISDLDDASSKNDASESPGTPSPNERHQNPRPMRWLFRDHELKSYPSPPPPGNAEAQSSTAGDDTPTSPQSSTLHPSESTTDSVNANVAHLTGATKPTRFFGKASHMFNSRPSSMVDENTNINVFRDVPAAEGSCYNFDFFDAGPSRQPWKWFETGRAENISKGAVMGPTYNISSLIPNPEGISLKRSYDPAPADTGTAGNTNPDTAFQQKPPSSSCSSSYVSALRDLKLDNSSPKPTPMPQPTSGSRGPKTSPPLSQRTSSSQSTVIKTPQTSPAEKGLPKLRDHFTAAASPLTMKGGYPPRMSAAADVKQPVYEEAPLVKTESCGSDVSEVADLEDRDFSFREPFYDWSIHDRRLHKNQFTFVTKGEVFGGELRPAVPPLRSAPGSVNFEFGGNSDLSTNLFQATKYMMRGAKLTTREDTSMTGGELKWPPSPTVYTLSSSTSSSDTGAPEPHHAQSTAVEADGDLLLPPTKRPLNPHRSPTKRPVPQEQSHILDEPIVFARNPYLQFHSPPITPTKPHSHAHAPVLDGDGAVFTLPPSATGHELCITISRSVTPTYSGDDDDAPPPAQHFDGNADEQGRKTKRVKSVHWGAATDAERRFAEEEGISYYEVESGSDEEEDEVVYDWSDDGEEGGDEDDDEDDDEEGEEGEEEGDGDEEASLCGSQVSTRGVVDAGW